MEDHSSFHNSSLYSPDLAPVPHEKRTWNTWQLAALWVGMAVCIPTYLLASYMIKSGLSWVESLLIIGIANLIITIPMVLNGHAGVKYGLPFPVIGRAAFGTKGIHVASIVRGVVACGWFGVQTWVGGLAIYEIINALTGNPSVPQLTLLKFGGFFIFWIINMYFIWKGTESIKWLEEYSAPILIFMGVLLIGWGAWQAKGFGIVLKQSEQLGITSAALTEIDGKWNLRLHPLTHKSGKENKANEFQVKTNAKENDYWIAIPENLIFPLPDGIVNNAEFQKSKTVLVQFRKNSESIQMASSLVTAKAEPNIVESISSKIWKYILWLTAMVGFWATMAISISDITRYSPSQKAQIRGQFMGLPGTMMLYSFVGIFVTCAAIINFNDILISEDAPWDPVSLLAKFQSPFVVIVAQIFMLIATLSTNIAANVIAPANAFSNILPKHISFRTGGLITGVIGILICPWWLMNEISTILIFVSGLLGPVLGILLSDYFLIRKKQLDVNELFNEKGIYSYSNGFNGIAVFALLTGIFSALIGLWIPALGFLYSLSWFTGFSVSFILYFVLMKRRIQK